MLAYPLGDRLACAISHNSMMRGIDMPKVYVVVPRYSDTMDTVADLQTAMNSARILCAENGGVGAYILRYDEFTYDDGSTGAHFGGGPDMAWDYYAGKRSRIANAADAEQWAFPRY